MKVIFYVGISLLLTILLSCSNSSKTKSSVFDELAYLNKHNSTERLYRDTPKYRELLEKSKVDLVIKYRTDLLEEDFYKNKPAKIVCDFETDTVIISKIGFTNGSCLDFYPYLDNKNGIVYLLVSEIIDANISVNNGDTSIYESRCTLENIIELQYKIPKSDIKNKKLYFEGKEILYN